MSVHQNVTGSRLLPRALFFSAGGTLRTENSDKYTGQTFTAPVYRVGFTQTRQCSDARDDLGLFAADA